MLLLFFPIKLRLLPMYIYLSGLLSSFFTQITLSLPYLELVDLFQDSFKIDCIFVV